MKPEYRQIASQLASTPLPATPQKVFEGAGFTGRLEELIFSMTGIRRMDGKVQGNDLAAFFGYAAAIGYLYAKKETKQ